MWKFLVAFIKLCNSFHRETTSGFCHRLRWLTWFDHDCFIWRCRKCPLFITSNHPIQKFIDFVAFQQRFVDGNSVAYGFFVQCSDSGQLKKCLHDGRTSRFPLFHLHFRQLAFQSCTTLWYQNLYHALWYQNYRDRIDGTKIARVWLLKYQDQ